MNHFMDLNKQHYQLGLTKIYMRENQKMRLDIRLHTKIIESIVSIQRWFRSILQRRKYLQQRQAVVTLQSGWRMYMAQKQVHHRRACFHGAAITIQAQWRMYVARRNYLKLHTSVVLIQAHIRGKLARMKFKQGLKQKHMRERQKLRSTQSLPVHERSIETHFEPVKRIRTPTPHYSLDADIELCQDPNESPSHRLSRQKINQLLDQTEQHMKDLRMKNMEDLYFARKSSVPTVDPYLSYQPPPTSYREDVLDLGSKVYEVEKVMRRNEELPVETHLKRFDPTKMPIRRVDSGPARREMRFDANNGAIRPTPATDVEIVFVDSTAPPLIPSSSAMSRSGPYNQQYSLDTLPQRRDIICRSLNEEYQNYQPPIVYHQMQHESLSRSSTTTTTTATATAVAPKGEFCYSTFK